MCLIAVKELNKELPKDEYLIQANKKNPDGIGLAYWKSGDNEVKIKKDFVDVTSFLSWIKSNITLEHICVIHFRYATHGLKDMGNRHPFPITKNKKLLREINTICSVAVAHNGVLREYNSSGTKFSDTQQFILDILSEEEVKNNLENIGIRKLIDNFINGDKLAILNNNGTLYYFGDFHEYEGIKYSNKSYEKPIEYHFEYNDPKWADYYNTKYAIKETFQNLIEMCYGCGEVKKVREIYTGDNLICLCKACRKKLNKGKISFDELYEGYEDKDKLKEEGLAKCEGCNEYKDTITEPIIQVHGLNLCLNCKKLLE